jgi:hypothetical protein
VKCTTLHQAPASLDAREVYEVYQATLPLQTVDPSSFELVTQTQPAGPGTSRLRSASVVNAGEDGSSWVVDDRLDDTQRNEFCYPLTAADGQERCLPYAASVYPETGNYSTSSCTGTAPWSVAQNHPCSTDARNTFAQYMLQGATTPAGCSGAQQYYPIFTDAPVDAIYYANGASCNVQDHSSASSYEYYADTSLPAPLDPGLFATVTTTDAPAAAEYGTAGSRLSLRTIHYAAADGFSADVLYSSLYDNALKTSCYPTDLGDGHLYCAPSVSSFDCSKSRGNLFADAACTTSVYGVTHASAACGGGAPAAGTILADTSFAVAGCGAQTYFRVPASPLTLTTLYGASNGVACAPIAVPVSTAFYRASDLTPITGSDLVAVSSLALETH